MRLWSLHPQYLDAKGIVALWRESLLAKNVLENKTKGYKNHPQLLRFKQTDNPTEAINQYLSCVYEESLKRGYNFDKSKIDWQFHPIMMSVNSGQLAFEFTHLLKKIEVRTPNMSPQLKREKHIRPHPMFKVRKGEIEAWEII